MANLMYLARPLPHYDASDGSISHSAFFSQGKVATHDAASSHSVLILDTKHKNYIIVRYHRVFECGSYAFLPTA